MFRFLYRWFPLLNKQQSRRTSAWNRRGDRHRSWFRHFWVWCLCLTCVGAAVGVVPVLVRAQDINQLEQQENQVIRELVLPEAPAEPPVYVPSPEPAYQPEPAPAAPPAAAADRSRPAEPTAGQPTEQPTEQATEQQPPEPYTVPYALEFTRSPVVGNRLRLQGVYPETRLGFTRPRNWKVKSAKAIIRYQHSPSLRSDRSHLTVRLNDTSIGSVPLDRPDAQLAQATFNIPVNLIQDYNEISMLAEQQTSETCTNPSDPTLWTEILPDSKIVFEFEPQPVTLDFSRYPYPFLDDLGLNPNQLVYLRPNTLSADWLTAAARYQTSTGRLADFRALDARLVDSLDQLQANDRLLIIGTPTEQPALSQLSLPFPLQNGKLLDGNRQPLPDDVGVLMMTTTQNKEVPVLVATGNTPAAVLKAVQFLVQSPDRTLGTGQAVTVTNLTQIPSPDPRAWTGYLPTSNEFQLRDLTLADGKPYSDVTVHGSKAPIIEVPFRALPDDRILQGSTMTLHYSHSDQINTRNSAIEVMADGVTIGSKRLNNGGQDETFNINLPAHLIKPDTVLGIHFILYPEQPGICGLEADQQLWGTLHADTSFKLKRDNIVQLPNLELLKAGFPLTAPQDLSATAIVLPDTPTNADIEMLLSFSERMGRISHADSVKLTAYLAGSVPNEVRTQQNIVGIGTRDRFPFPEVFEQPQGLALASSFLRVWQQSQIQTLPDKEGVVKAIPSPWSRDRVLLALTSQTEDGLKEVQDLFNRDPLFSQLRGDTVLISRNQANPSPFDPGGYNLQFLQQSQPRQIQNTTVLRRIVLFLQDHWWVMLISMVVIALLLYSFSQLFMNRVARN